MILDATTWEKRQGPDKQAETPAQESARRGKTEVFAQGVGRITISLGQGKSFISTGTLIAPNIMLTAAHCVDKITGSTAGYFDLNGVQSKIISVQMPASYILKLVSSKATHFEDDDIAVVLLEKSIHLDSYPELSYDDASKLISNTINSGHVPKFIGVSAGILTKNADPSSTYSGRHIGIFSMRKSGISSHGSLEAESWIPVNYKPQPVQATLDGKVYVPEFSYDFKRDGVFLHATLRGGDSGGPLFAKIQGKMVIVGVAGGQIFKDAYDKKTNQFVPAKTYRDCWTSIYYHRIFIQQAIEKFSSK